MNRKVTPCRLQLAHAREQALDLVAVELGGRLVEDDEAGAIGECTGDLDELARLDLEIAGAGVFRYGDVPAIEQDRAPRGGARVQLMKPRSVGWRLTKRFSATVRSGMMVECW